MITCMCACANERVVVFMRVCVCEIVCEYRKCVVYMWRVVLVCACVCAQGQVTERVYL